MALGLVSLEIEPLTLPALGWWDRGVFPSRRGISHSL